MGYVENIKSIMQWGNSFERQGNFPLDRTDLHISYDDAVLYAKGDASDSRKLGKLAYVGQTITVWGLNEKGKEGVWVYSLVPSSKENFLADLQPVGGGSSTENAENYSAAKELSKTLVVGQLIKVANAEEIEETVDGETVKNTYQAGFYIVEASGVISALATSTGSDDEIGALKARVDVIETNYVTKDELPNVPVHDVKYGENSLLDENGNAVLDDFAKSADVYSKRDADSTFVKLEDYVEYSTDEKTKLANIAEGAQVNVLEGVKVNDVELTIGEDKKVNIDLSAYAIANETATKSALEALEQIVNGKAESEDVYTKTEVDDTFLKIADKYNDTEVRNLISGVSGRIDTLETFKHVSDVTYNTTDKKIYLVSGDEKIGGGFDASAFIKDGMVSSVAYAKDKHQITITFNTDHGGDDVTIDLSDLVNVYTNGDGLKLSEDGITFSVDFDTVAKKSDLDALNALIGKEGVGETSATGIFAELAALAEKNGEQDSAIAAKADQSVVDTLSGVVDTKAAKSEVEALSLLVGTRAEGDIDSVFTKLAALASAVDSKLTKNATVNNVAFEDGAVVIDAANITLDEDITRTGEDGEVENVYAAEVSIQSVLASLSQRIDVLDPNVSGELGITSIIEGNGISVTTSGGQATIASKIANRDDNAISVDGDGLFVQAITFDGNDTEQ